MDSHKEDSLMLTEDSFLTRLEEEKCSIHRKMVEVVCMTDRVGVCSHCAIFGTHKQHQLKPVVEFLDEIDAKGKFVRLLKAVRQESSAKYNREAAADTIEGLLTNKKKELLNEINNIFGEISTYVEIARRTTIEDLNLLYQELQQSSNKVLTQINRTQMMYQNWMEQCENTLEHISNVQSITSKASSYFESPLVAVEDGEKHLHAIQETVNRCVKEVESNLSLIKATSKKGLEKLILNYVTIESTPKALFSSGNLQSVSMENLLFQQPQQRFGNNSMLNSGRSVTFKNLNIRSVKSIIRPISPCLESMSSTVRPERYRVQSKLNNARSSNKMPEITEQKTPLKQLISDYCETSGELVDLTRKSFGDNELVGHVVNLINRGKNIKHLKCMGNRLTNQGLAQLLDLMPKVTHLNLAYNLLTDAAVEMILMNKPRMSQLRIVNLGSNKINERKVKAIIEQLKRKGVIVTI